MAQQVFQDLARVRIVGEIHGSETVNVLHFARFNSDVDLPTLLGKLQLLAQNVVECAIDNLLVGISSDWTFRRVEAQGVKPIATDPQIAQAPAGTNGAGGPQGVTIAASLIQLRSGRDGRKGRGRIFLPPAGEASIANGDWDAQWLLRLTNFCICLANKFGEPAGTEEWRIGILSRKDFNAVGGTVANSFRAATQLAPQALAASMRTRKKGVGA